ncbi:hypothetical protein D3C85_1426880 [compost metagenome]
MRERRAIEVEPQRFLRALANVLQPEEGGVGVDKAPDQPGTGNTVHPEVLSCCPASPLVLGGVAPRNPARHALRFAWRKHDVDGCIEIAPLCFGTDRGFIREVINPADRIVCATVPARHA